MWRSAGPLEDISESLTVAQTVCAISYSTHSGSQLRIVNGLLDIRGPVLWTWRRLLAISFTETVSVNFHARRFFSAETVSANGFIAIYRFY